MGWYAECPGNTYYKHGNVHALAKECQLGEFMIAPKIYLFLQDEGEDVFEDPYDDIVFLSDFQNKINKLNLPWSFIDFVNHDYIKVSPQKKRNNYFSNIEKIVASNITSFERCVNWVDVSGQLSKVFQFYICLDFCWKLDKKDWSDFLTWITIPMNQSLSLEIMNKGTIKNGLYSLPQDFVREVGKLDASRCFGLNALGMAILSKEELILNQPDDANQSGMFLIG